MKCNVELKTGMAKVVRQFEYYAYMGVALLLFGYIVYRAGLAARYGLDFSDEGYYLAWMSNPELYKFNHPVTFFPNLFAPIFRYFDYGVFELRLVNILLTIFLATITSFIAIRQYSNIGSGRQAFLVFTLSIGIGAQSTLYFATGISTPSYNSTCFQGLLIATIGLLRIAKNKNNVIGWVVYGCGCWVVFMGKPSSAIALYFASLLYFIYINSGVRKILLSMLVMLFLVSASAVFIDETLTAFADRLLLSIEYQKILNVGHDVRSILRIDGYEYSSAEYYLSISLLLIFVALRLCTARLHLFIILAITFYIVFLIDHPLLLIAPSGMVQLLVCLPLLAYASWPRTTNKSMSTYCVQDRADRALLLLLFVMPFIYSFGTNNNNMLQGSFLAYYWVLVTIVVIRKKLSIRFGTLLLFVIIFAIPLSQSLNASTINPYRQPKYIFSNSATLHVGDDIGIIVSDEFNEYISSARSVVQSRYHSGNKLRMIDLTGSSPGLIFYINAMVVGLPWINGGYVGSDKLAVTSFMHADCNDLAAAWILDEPYGDRRLSPSVLDSFGSSIDYYESVGTITTPPDTAGYKKMVSQRILIPTRSFNDSYRSCLRARRNK